jgi:hypothetical protein
MSSLPGLGDATHRNWLARLSRALAAGVAAGLLLGVLGRIAMALLAMYLGRAGFTLGGSLEVVATGLAIGVPAALAFAWLERFLRGGPALRGATFGAALFLLLALVPPPAARSALVGTPSRLHVLAALLFGLAFVVYGIALGLAAARLGILSAAGTGRRPAPADGDLAPAERQADTSGENR